MVDVKSALGLDAPRPPRHLGAAHQASAHADEPEREQEPGEQKETGELASPFRKVDMNGDFGRRRHADILTPRWP